MEPQKNANEMGATEIFRMSSTDATSPDIMDRTAQIRPTLSIVKGPQAGSVFELDSTDVTVGRDPTNTVFLNDMTVSRHHARIDLSSASAGYATIEDLGSLNGTWVDGAIVSKAVLKDGSTVQIGTFRMVFHANKKTTRIETGA